MKFINDKLFKKQTIELLSAGLKINKKTFFDSIEYEISYEQINNKKMVQSTINNNLLFIGFSCIFIGVLFLFGSFHEITPILMMIGLLFCILTFITKRKVVTISRFDGTNIELYFTEQNKTMVIEFADKIINSANNYLLNKYSRIDKALPIESQLHSLQFLRDREIITEQHFENLKNQLLGRDNKSTIGFNYGTLMI